MHRAAVGMRNARLTTAAQRFAVYGHVFTTEGW